MLVGQLKRPSLIRPTSSGGADGETTIFEVREVRFFFCQILCEDKYVKVTEIREGNLVRGIL